MVFLCLPIYSPNPIYLLKVPEHYSLSDPSPPGRGEIEPLSSLRNRGGFFILRFIFINSDTHPGRFNFIVS